MNNTARKRRGRLSKLFSTTYSAMVFLFLYAPIAVMIILSFNNSKSRTVWGGFTFKWYESLFSNRDIMESLWNTLLLAFLSALIATVIGTFAAVGLHSVRGWLKRSLMTLSYIPMLNPDIVTGISLLLLFSFLGIKLGFNSLLIAHVTFNIPYVILSVMPKLTQMNPNMYEAALDLGMTPIRAIFKVIIPEITPGIVSGFILSLTLSIDDFIISFFTTGPGVSTLSITIYSMARRGIKPEINALSSIMFAVVITLLIIVNIRSTRGSRDGVMTSGGIQ